MYKPHVHGMYLFKPLELLEGNTIIEDKAIDYTVGKVSVFNISQVFSNDWMKSLK